MVLRFCIKLFSCVLNAEPNHYHYLLLKVHSGVGNIFPPSVAQWRRVGIADHLLMLCSIVVLISNRWARMLWLKFCGSVLTCKELSISSTTMQRLGQGTGCDGHPEI